MQRRRTPIRIGIRSSLASRKICTTLLLAVVPVALTMPVGDVASGQTGAGTAAQVPQFTAIDLNPPGFVESWATAISGGRQVGYGYGPATGGYGHALLWHGSAADVVDLHPNGFMISRALGISGGQEVGVGISSQPAGGSHALLWRGSAGSVVDLHPRGFVRSEASGISGEQQVGYGYGPATGEYRNALLWRGSASSVVDLHPHRFVRSEASGISGGQQVGFGSIGDCVPSESPVRAALLLAQDCHHALLWRRDGSVVDLNPSGSSSGAVGISGGQIVGSSGSWPSHALLWRTDGSVVDLNPSGVGLSKAEGVSGAEQVGYGYGYGPPGNLTHALLWRGDVNSVVDLHPFLPPGFDASHATGIDSNGDIVGYASGRASDNRNHAFLWRRKAGATAPAPPTGTPTPVPTLVTDERVVTVNAGGEAEIIVMDPLGHEFLPKREENHWELQMFDQMPGEYTVDVIGTGNGWFGVDVTVVDASRNDIAHFFQGLTAPGRISRFSFSGGVHPFVAFGARVKIRPSSKSFEVNGTFTLGPGGTISPETQPVTIWLHRILTIPPGSFRQTGQGTFVFDGTLEASTVLRVLLTQTGDKSYSFKIEGVGETDLPTENPVNVELAIGDNGGWINVNADFARE